MNQNLIYSFEVTDDYLFDGNIHLRQPKIGYRVSIDTILLAAAVPAKNNEMILDLGSGTGASAICLHYRVRNCRVVGLENDPNMLALAKENVLLNGFEKKITFIEGTVIDLPKQIGKELFDHVISNPPYLNRERADLRKNSNSQRNNANVENDVDLSSWIKSMSVSLKPKGRLTLIHRADRLDEVLKEVRLYAGEITVYPIWPKSSLKANRVLVTARKNVATPLSISSGLVVHTKEGKYTRVVKSVLEKGEALSI